MKLNLGTPDDEGAYNDRSARSSGVEPQNPASADTVRQVESREGQMEPTPDAEETAPRQEGPVPEKDKITPEEAQTIPKSVGRVIFGTERGLFFSGDGVLKSEDRDVGQFEFSELRRRGGDAPGEAMEFTRTVTLDGRDTTVHGLVMRDRDSFGRAGFFGTAVALPDGEAVNMDDIKAEAGKLFSEAKAARDQYGMTAAADRLLNGDTQEPALSRSNRGKTDDMTPDPDRTKGNAAEDPEQAGDPLTVKVAPTPLSPRAWDVKQMQAGAPLKSYDMTVTGMATPGGPHVAAQMSRPTSSGNTDAENHAPFVRSNIPPRPSRWPGLMAWPNEEDVMLLARKKASAEQIEEYYKAMKEKVPVMMARADQIDRWIREATPKGHFAKGWTRREHPIRFWRNTWKDEALKDDTYKGVRWATLLNPDGGVKAPDVVRWGHYRLETADGGRLSVSQNNSMRMHGDPTKQAVTMMIREGRARGWDTIRLTGGPAFAKMAREIAQQEGINAEIVTTRGPLGVFKSKSAVMNAPPSPEMEVKGPEGDQNGKEKEKSSDNVGDNDGVEANMKGTKLQKEAQAPAPSGRSGPSEDVPSRTAATIPDPSGKDPFSKAAGRAAAPRENKMDAFDRQAAKERQAQRDPAGHEEGLSP